MLAQWISWAAREQFRKARTEPLITLGSAPLDVSEFRAVVLGQLGEARLDVAIDADLAAQMSHAKALDADAHGVLRDIHRRVGTTILFESSGGQVDRVAHLPELRFALGEPEVDTATIDNAASALETSAFFIRKVGTDGYRIHHQATLKKVVSDRRASLDEDTEVKPAMRKLVETVFRRGATVSVVAYPDESAAVPDSPRLVLVVLDPDEEWKNGDQVVERTAAWTKERGTSSRLYPGSLVWCAKKPGRQLREKVELWLAWQRVAHELTKGTLGADFDRADRTEVQAKVRDAETAAQDEVWAAYRYLALSDANEKHGLKIIDLGAGHSSGSETLCGRVIGALKSEALLNENVGAGYIDRNWPPAFAGTGAWPLRSLRQSFLDGSLTRLIDPERILRQRISELVLSGEFGLASKDKGDGTFGRLWLAESVAHEEVAFEPSVFLLTKKKAEELKATPVGIQPQGLGTTPVPVPQPKPGPEPEAEPEPTSTTTKTKLRIRGTVPPEVWNRLGTKVLPKLRKGEDLNVGVEFSMSVGSQLAPSMEAELEQILSDLGLGDRIKIDRL